MVISPNSNNLGNFSLRTNNAQKQNRPRFNLDKLLCNEDTSPVLLYLLQLDIRLLRTTKVLILLSVKTPTPLHLRSLLLNLNTVVLTSTPQVMRTGKA